MERSHQTARDLLGIDKPDVVFGPDRVKALMDTLATAGDARALVIMLGLVIGAHEAATYVDMWRSPASHSDTARYFSRLASWGYELSEIEQAIVDGKPLADAKAAA